MTYEQPARPWRMVCGLFLVLTMSSGFGFYNLSLYMAAMVDERGMTTAAASLAVSLVFLVGGFSGLLVARLMDRMDVRLLMTAGALLGGLALALAGMAESLAGLYLAFALFGLGNAGVSLIPATTLVARAFSAQRRALGLSVTSTGLSVGGVVVTPLSAWLVAQLGIGVALPWFGLGYAGLLLLVVWLLIPGVPPVSDPDPDPVTGPEPGAVMALQPGIAAMGTSPAANPARSRYFLLLTAAWVLVQLAQVGGIAHLYPAVAEVAGPGLAASAVSVLAVASIGGRLAGGWLLQWVPAAVFARCCMVLQATALLGLATAADWGAALGHVHLAVLLAAGCFGLSVGNLLMMPALLVAAAFGTANYARLFALNQLLVMFGVALGPALLGLVHDLAVPDGYLAAYGLAAAAAALGLVLFQMGGRAPAA